MVQKTGRKAIKRDNNGNVIITLYEVVSVECFNPWHLWATESELMEIVNI